MLKYTEETVTRIPAYSKEKIIDNSKGIGCRFCAVILQVTVDQHIGGFGKYIKHTH